jgi:hypothetical protein
MHFLGVLTLHHADESQKESRKYELIEKYRLFSIYVGARVKNSPTQNIQARNFHEFTVLKL